MAEYAAVIEVWFEAPDDDTADAFIKDQAARVFSLEEVITVEAEAPTPLS